MNLLTVELFPDSIQCKMRETLENLRKKHPHLFSEKSLLSGDPSPPNWGYRQSGDLVLFDWERVGTGSPALDLAPVIYGDQPKSVIDKVAEYYLGPSHSRREQVILLSHDIEVAYAWLVVDLLSFDCQGQGGLHPKAKAKMVAEFPKWLEAHFE